MKVLIDESADTMRELTLAEIEATERELTRREQSGTDDAQKITLYESFIGMGLTDAQAKTAAEIDGSDRSHSKGQLKAGFMKMGLTEAEAEIAAAL